MVQRKPRRPAPPLNETSLRELALGYVGRFATTRAKLRAYLGRKLRERGWDGRQEPDPGGLADAFADQGYVDDSGYALAKARALADRGYGKRRLMQKLRGAGVDDEDSAAARELSDARAIEAALRFAERRRIGPFGSGPGDPRTREKGFAAMVRAGHSFALARAIVGIAPGTPIDREELIGLAEFDP